MLEGLKRSARSTGFLCPRNVCPEWRGFLAAGANNIGFSGTNDNRRLLPLSVTQREPEDPSLLGTNGKIIDKNPASDSQLRDKKAQALIDTGALLAGVANHDATVGTRTPAG
ncbi:hypothetical protein GN244_ATG03067 [Phytophthora infestans]|uniref:Uncharacterized protein n=1 Tax=Phytophthora infestans TaxID=4787 RepID=A0A833WKN8_PHYIN|nr:hypothetical protein GN244_ATG03067 [Phytophthora infestans]